MSEMSHDLAWWKARAIARYAENRKLRAALADRDEALARAFVLASTLDPDSASRLRAVLHGDGS